MKTIGQLTSNGNGGDVFKQGINDLTHVCIPVKRVDAVPSNPFFKKKTMVVTVKDDRELGNLANEINPDELNHQSLETVPTHRSEDRTGP